MSQVSSGHDAASTPAPPERRRFIVEAATVVIGAIVGLVPLATGLFAYCDPLRRKQRQRRVRARGPARCAGGRRHSAAISGCRRARRRLEPFARAGWRGLSAAQAGRGHARVLVGHLPARRLLRGLRRRRRIASSVLATTAASTWTARSFSPVPARERWTRWMQGRRRRGAGAVSRISIPEKPKKWPSHEGGNRLAGQPHRSARDSRTRRSTRAFRAAHGGATCGAARLVFAFATQVITGMFLWMFYSPSAQTAWESVFYHAI